MIIIKIIMIIGDAHQTTLIIIIDIIAIVALIIAIIKAVYIMVMAIKMATIMITAIIINGNHDCRYHDHLGHQT